MSYDTKMKVCARNNCFNPVASHGYCAGCLWRIKKHNDPFWDRTKARKTQITKQMQQEVERTYGSDVAIIPLTKGFYTIIDREDCDKVSQYHWCYSDGYALYRLGRLKLHRLVLCAKRGGIVDHVNGDTLDNRKSNLRCATLKQNSYNRRSPTGATGFKGVTKKGNRFYGQIQREGEKFSLGSYHTAEEAAEAYDKAALELFGEFALTNKMLGLL